MADNWKKRRKIKWRVFEESIDENSRRLILNALILNWEYRISEIWDRLLLTFGYSLIGTHRGGIYLHGQPWEFGFISERSVKRTQPRCSDDPGCSSRRLVHCFLSILWIFLVLHTALVYRLLHFAECVSQKNLILLNELVIAYYSLDMILV